MQDHKLNTGLELGGETLQGCEAGERVDDVGQPHPHASSCATFVESPRSFELGKSGWKKPLG
jgi:hypothetical protein